MFEEANLMQKFKFHKLEPVVWGYFCTFLYQMFDLSFVRWYVLFQISIYQSLQDAHILLQRSLRSHYFISVNFWHFDDYKSPRASFSKSKSLKKKFRYRPICVVTNFLWLADKNALNTLILLVSCVWNDTKVWYFYNVKVFSAQCLNFALNCPFKFTKC